VADPKVDRSDRHPPPLDPLRRAIVEHPGDAQARRRLAWALLAARALDEALTVFRQAVRDFPDDVDLLYGQALAAKQAGSVDEADEAFLRVARLAEAMTDPGRSEILHRLAMGHHNILRTGRWGLKREVWGGS